LTHRQNFNTGGVEKNVSFNPDNLLQIPTLLLRFFSFSSFEIPIFIGHDTPSRIAYFEEQPWVIPIAGYLFVVGIAQVGFYIYSLFKNNKSAIWKKVRRFTIASLVLLSCAFLFSVSEPRSHTFYIFFPLSVWYSFYCFPPVLGSVAKKILALTIALGILFHVSLFFDRLEERSLFVHRSKICKALEMQDYTFLGLRRTSKINAANAPNLWTTIENDSSLSYFTGFEPPEPYFKPQNIVKTKAYEGKYSCKIDSIQPFGQGLTVTVPNTHAPECVRVSFYVHSKTNQSLELVCETQSGADEKSWNSTTIQIPKMAQFYWHHIQANLPLPPNLSQNSVIKMAVHQM
jgi:hypothetical protein